MNSNQRSRNPLYQRIGFYGQQKWQPPTDDIWRIHLEFPRSYKCFYCEMEERASNRQAIKLNYETSPSDEIQLSTFASADGSYNICALNYFFTGSNSARKQGKCARTWPFHFSWMRCPLYRDAAVASAVSDTAAAAARYLSSVVWVYSRHYIYIHGERTAIIQRLVCMYVNKTRDGNGSTNTLLELCHSYVLFPRGHL